jgi:uncharacterized protein YjiS (DUF1127 family)
MLTHSLSGKTHRGRFVRGLVQRFVDRGIEARSRRRLALLDDHLLSDIGLSRAEALAEASRTDWDAPDHWYR